MPIMSHGAVHKFTRQCPETVHCKAKRIPIVLRVGKNLMEITRQVGQSTGHTSTHPPTRSDAGRLTSHKVLKTSNPGLPSPEVPQVGTKGCPSPNAPHARKTTPPARNGLRAALSRRYHLSTPPQSVFQPGTSREVQDGCTQPWFGTPW